MKRVKNNATVEVMGVKFFGVREMIRYARSERPKYGVYVGEDSERYPCFDYEDYATENRYYTNLVFADSREELERKLNRLRSMNKPSCNYNKLTANLHPMAYWRGDNSDDVIFTEEGDDE